MFKFRHLASGVALLAVFSSAQAGPLAVRAGVQAALGGPSTMETFENFAVGVAVSLDCPAINSGAVCNAQGPGLVVGGIDLKGGTLQWNGAGYFGSPSQEVLGQGNTLTLDFTTTVNAFGVDLRAFSGYGNTSDISIYGLDDTTLIGTLLGVNMPNDGSPTFAGWADAAGIGKVEFLSSVQSWSPIIDNLEFGATFVQQQVPEPSTLALFGLALLGLGGLKASRRAK